MRFSWEHLVAIAAGALVILLAWFSPSWFHQSGWNMVMLITVILVIGAAGIAGFLMWARSNQPAVPSASMPSMSMDTPSVPGISDIGASGESLGASFAASGMSPDDINVLVREAESKIASARLGHGAKLASLRVFFVVGEAGSGKTTAVLHSGLDPELLAGQVFQDGTVTPTRSANFWFARKSVLVEAGSSLMREPRLWGRLVQRLSRRGLRTIFAGKTQAERAALVCVDAEKLAKATSTDKISGTASLLRARLEEMSNVLGSSFPVYVLFTRADRLSSFDDFVSTMTNEEASQVFGVTLPVTSDSATSVYAERETKRLTTAFTSLFSSLADHRPGLLSREHNNEKQAGVYEFPRQFRKLAKPAVQFLVDLCRPSQLRAGPFLRGFYFTGTRTVAMPVSSPTIEATRTSFMGSQAPPVGNATSILRPEDLAAMPGWQTATSTQTMRGDGGKTTQSIFMSHIFSQILFQDTGALGASKVSSRTNFWRRALYATIAVVGFAWSIGLVVSYFSNRALQSDFTEAANRIHSSGSSSTQPATLESLQQLDAMRKSLVNLADYEKNGAPWHFRWGLFVGQDFYVEARKVYFLRFKQVLFEQIQNQMLEALRVLPNSPGPNDEYAPNYATLKAYLITTSNPDKSTPEFLTPVLEKYRELKDQNQDSSMKSLAIAQLDFYARELKVKNPYSSEIDTQAVGHAQGYLNQSGAVPRVYAAIKDAAAKQIMPANYSFYEVHLGARDLIRGVPEKIPAAFVKDGWDFMQKAITNSGQYFNGDVWVLGETSKTTANSADIESQLRAVYLADFIKQWQVFLQSAKILPYGSIPDAASKLKRLEIGDSPLLGLLCDASQNTTGRSADVDAAFKPVQQVAPASACGSSGSVPQPLIPYVGGLANLQGCFDLWSTLPAEKRDEQRQACNSNAIEARKTVDGQIMPPISRDPIGHLDQTIRQLLEAPINVPGPPAVSGGGAKDLCASFNQINAKYPFNSHDDSPGVTLDELNAFFRPDDTGALQKFIHANQGVLILQGTQYTTKPGATVEWAKGVLPSLNRAFSIQQSLYPPGTAQPQYKFNVRAIVPEGGISGGAFTLNGQKLDSSSGSQTTTFAWPGNGQEASVSYRDAGPPDTTLASRTGLWAITRLISYPHTNVAPSGNTLSVQWQAHQGDGTPISHTGSKTPIGVRVEFDGGTGSFALWSNNFTGMPVCRAGR